MTLAVANLTPLRTSPARHPWRNRAGTLTLRLALLSVLLGLAGSIQPASSAVTGLNATSVEQSFLTRIAIARASHGLPAYRLGGVITGVARDQARRMADQETLFHNPRLTSEVPNWRYVGENVGYGPDVVTVHRAFMGSAPHRANILDQDFTRVGVGAVVRNGRVWVSEVFKTPRD
jgi:uncharacterized protein YkwD